MADMDYDACYAALGLKIGAGLKQVNEAWRRLSRIHHPDQHTRDPQRHKQALEKQKHINNARDVLKKWFERNPTIPPPTTSGGARSNQSQSKSSQSTAGNAGDRSQSKSQSSYSGSQQCNYRSDSQHSHSGHQKNAQSNPYSSSFRTGEGSTRTETPAEQTGWFSPSDFTLTPLQKFARTLAADNKCCNDDHVAIIRVIVGLAAVIGPMWLVSSLLRALFPEMPSDLPDWLQMSVLATSGYISWYLFRWFFVETEIIKLQQKVFYFRAERSPANTLEFVKLVIDKQKPASAQWTFLGKGINHEGVLEYEEQIVPELKRKRRLAIRFAAKAAGTGAVAAVEIRAKSPINSFSCNKLVKAIITELKSELRELAA